MSSMSAPGGGAAETANIFLNAFRIQQALGLAARGMIDGLADEFEDEAGVDTVASSGQTFVAGSHYSNPGSAAKITNETATGDYTYGSRLANAFDGTTAQTATVAAQSNALLTSYIGQTWALAKTVAQYIAYAPSDTGFGADDGDLTFTLQGSNDGAAWDDLHSTSAFDHATASVVLTVDSGITQAAYLHHRLKVVGTTSANNRYFAEVEFYEAGSAPALDLKSNATAADAQPSSALVVLWHETVEAVDLNVDLIAEVSRDGGTNWTPAVLSQSSILGTGRILTGTVSLAGQPAGTSMKWRVRAPNNTALYLHGVGLQWS